MRLHPTRHEPEQVGEAVEVDDDLGVVELVGFLQGAHAAFSGTELSVARTAPSHVLCSTSSARDFSLGKTPRATYHHDAL